MDCSSCVTCPARAPFPSHKRKDCQAVSIRFHFSQGLFEFREVSQSQCGRDPGNARRVLTKRPDRFRMYLLSSSISHEADELQCPLMPVRAGQRERLLPKRYQYREPGCKVLQPVPLPRWKYDASPFYHIFCLLCLMFCQWSNHLCRCRHSGGPLMPVTKS